MGTPDEAEQMQRSTRDYGVLRDQVRTWLAGRLPQARQVTVSPLTPPSANGMSSETMLFDASWADDGGTHGAKCVARLAPAEEAVPVFPSYDMEKQFTVMRLARERANVPAPRTLWFEADPHHLGSPFFVMEREIGEVPPDVMPYTFGGWLCDAPVELQLKLQSESIQILARLHWTDYSPDEIAFLGSPDDALRRHVDDQRAYYEWAHGTMRVPVLEQAFAWLDQHWPSEPGPTVVSWGDARIGNVIYRDFSPVAVLDWEMAGLAPPEVDIGWMIFLHRFFQDITEVMELPGMPDFMQKQDVCRIYQEMTGYRPRDMEFYEMYGALRHGIVMARVWHRRIHFGEQEMPDDPNDLVMHRTAIEKMLDGSYWS